MIRLQKLLAEAGLGSRRTSEERIRAGRGRLGLDGRRLDRGRPCRASYSFITGPSAAPGGTGRRAPGPGLPPAGLAPPGRGVRPAVGRPPEATLYLANRGAGRIDKPVARTQTMRI